MNKDNYFITNGITIIKKWNPVVSKFLVNVRNEEILDIFCLYCEWISMKIHNEPDIQFGLEYTGIDESIPQSQSILPDMMRLAHKKINNLGVRKKVMSEWYNPILDDIEYCLEDGTFITKNSKPSFDLDLYTKVFPSSFLSNIYPDIARDMKLNNILDGGIN